MNKHKIKTWLAIAITFVMGMGHSLPSLADAHVVRVYAASSLTEAINEISVQFTKVYGIEVQTIIAGSGQLARQITYGAPADVYISANTDWVDYLHDQGIESTLPVASLASNSLVVVTSQTYAEAFSKLLPEYQEFDSQSSKSWLAWLQSERLAIGNPSHVPVGIYSKQVLTNLNVWKKLQLKTAPMNNARMVLTMVERGDVPLGIVYNSDVRSSNRDEPTLTVLAALNTQMHEEIQYPVVTLSASSSAAQFTHYLRSQESLKVLRDAGFNVEN